MNNKLGVYIGSFNPPHIGHKQVANYLIDNNYVDKLLLIPTNNYWNKQNLIELRHRINMLKYYETNNIKVDTIHNNYDYTYELFRVLKEKYPEYNLYLVMGADNIIRFNEWKNVEELLNYNIIVLKRGNIDINAYIDKYNYDKSKFIVIDNYPLEDISSTIIRNNLSSSYLDNKVYKYVKNNNLYR